jgi:hypothetical protein
LGCHPCRPCPHLGYESAAVREVDRTSSVACFLCQTAPRGPPPPTSAPGRSAVQEASWSSTAAEGPAPPTTLSRPCSACSTTAPMLPPHTAALLLARPCSAAPPAAAPLPLATPRGRATRARQRGKQHAMLARRGREGVKSE